MTPIRVSIAGAIASIILILVVARARPRAAAEGALRAALARDRESSCSSSPLWREGLNTIAGWLGVTSYPPAVLFAVATLFIFLVLLHYSTVISRLTDENVDLAQRIALLEERLSRERPTGRLNANTSPASGSSIQFVPDADAVGRGRRRATRRRTRGHASSRSARCSGGSTRRRSPERRQIVSSPGPSWR